MFKSCIYFIFFMGFAIFGGLAHAALVDIETAILQEDFIKAQQLAEDFISQNPSSEELKEAQYYLGLTYLHQGQYPKATEIFQQLIKEKSNRLRDKAQLGIIDSYYMTDRYEDALLEAGKLINLSPKSEYLSLIYLKLARANLKLTKWNEARQYLEKIIAQFPESMEAHLAKQLLEEKQYFAVQVGAFLNRERAQQLVLELKSKGEYAYVVETVDRTEKKFYRVRVGKFIRLEEADKLKTRLSKLGYPTRIYP